MSACKYVIRSASGRSKLRLRLNVSLFTCPWFICRSSKQTHARLAALRSRKGRGKPTFWPIRSDFRVVSASHQDLRTGVRNGTFRHDLLYRLCAVQIELPPLRARGSDIADLAEYFARALRPDQHLSQPFTAEALAEIQRRAWPGNVRELRNVINRALIISRNDRITVDGRALRRSGTADVIRVIAYHKPAGEVCTRSDPEGRPTVFASLPVLSAGRWLGIGRLDVGPMYAGKPAPGDSERIDEFLDIGVSHFIAMFGRVDDLRSTELFARTVLPHFHRQMVDDLEE